MAMGRLAGVTALLAGLLGPAGALQVLQSSADAYAASVAGDADVGGGDELLLEVSSAAQEAPPAPSAAAASTAAADTVGARGANATAATAAAPGAAAAAGSPSAEDQAFLTVRRQLSQEQLDDSTMRRQLEQSAAWGNAVAQRLAASEQSRQDSIRQAVEAKAREAAEAASASAARETALRRRLNASEAQSRQRSSELADTQQQLKTALDELQAAKKAANATHAVLLQEGSDLKHTLAARDATIAWLKSKTQSQESDLGADNSKLRNILKKAAAHLKEDRSVEGQLRQRLKQQRSEAKKQEAKLENQLSTQASQLKDEGQRVEQLRQQLAVLDRRVSTQAAAHEVPSSGAVAVAPAAVESTPAESDAIDEVLEIPE